MKTEIAPIYGKDRIKLADVVPLRMPFTVNVFPTNICNFACNYCIQSVGGKRLKEEFNFLPTTMKMQTFERLVDQVKEFPDKLKLMSMMGHGEPLINKQLPKMIALAKKNDLTERIEIITNGSLLTKSLGQELIDSGLDTIRISLQGITSLSYKETSNASLDFDMLIDNIRFLHEHSKGCKVFVKVLDVSLGYGDEEKFYKIFNGICDRMYVEKVMPVYDGVKYSSSNITMDRYGREHEKRMVCPLCFFTLSVWPDGNVYPCDAFHRPLLLGNLETRRLVEMWNDISHVQFCMTHLKKERNMLMGCNTCCAPDDVSQPEDVLDLDAEKILRLYSHMENEL